MIMILAAGRIRLPQASGQGRKTVAIGQRVNFLPCLAHGTILDKAGHISGDILRGKQADHGDVAHLLQGAEDSCDPLRGASVILDALECASRGLSRIHRGDQQQDILFRHHGAKIIPEDQKSVGIVLRCDDADIFFAAQGKEILLRELAGEKRTDDLAAVQADDRIDLLFIDIVIVKSCLLYTSPSPRD